MHENEDRDGSLEQFVDDLTFERLTREQRFAAPEDQDEDQDDADDVVTLLRRIVATQQRMQEHLATLAHCAGLDSAHIERLAKYVLELEGEVAELRDPPDVA